MQDNKAPMVTKKKTWLHLIIPIFLMGMLFAFSPCSSSISWSSDSTTEATFSLNVRNETLGSVIKKISTATGYEIVASGDYLKSPITVSIKDADVIDGLRRVLKNYNHSLIEDKESRRVNILILGKKDSKENSFPGSSIADINEYAKKYIKDIRKNAPEPILAEDIDEYAKEYARRVEKKNQEPIQADNIDDYAELYTRSIEQNNQKPVPIQADSMDEYAEKYIRSTEHNNRKPIPIQADSMDEYAKKYIKSTKQGK